MFYEIPARVSFSIDLVSLYMQTQIASLIPLPLGFFINDSMLSLLLSLMSDNLSEPWLISTTSFKTLLSFDDDTFTAIFNPLGRESCFREA